MALLSEKTREAFLGPLNKNIVSFNDGSPKRSIEGEQ